MLPSGGQRQEALHWAAIPSCRLQSWLPPPPQPPPRRLPLGCLPLLTPQLLDSTPSHNQGSRFLASCPPRASGGRVLWRERRLAGRRLRSSAPQSLICMSLTPACPRVRGGLLRGCPVRVRLRGSAWGAHVQPLGSTRGTAWRAGAASVSLICRFVSCPAVLQLSNASPAPPACPPHLPYTGGGSSTGPNVGPPGTSILSSGYASTTKGSIAGEPGGRRRAAQGSKAPQGLVSAAAHVPC